MTHQTRTPQADYDAEPLEIVERGEWKPEDELPEVTPDDHLLNVYRRYAREHKQPEDGRMALAAINDAEAALARATEIGEILTLRDKAAAAVTFALAQGFRDAAQQAKIFQLRAERKAGAWLAENVHPGNPQLSQDGIIATLPEGIDAHESSRWQLEASLPEDRFNEWVDECLAHAWELSAGALRKIAANHNDKHGSDPMASRIAWLKRLFAECWPEGARDRDRARELIMELSGLLMEVMR